MPVPARYRNSDYVTGLVASNSRALKRAREAQGELKSATRVAVEHGLLGGIGAFVAGGVDKAAEGLNLPVPLSIAPGLVAIGAGAGAGSVAVQAMGWGAIHGSFYKGGQVAMGKVLKVKLSK